MGGSDTNSSHTTIKSIPPTQSQSFHSQETTSIKSIPPAQLSQSITKTAQSSQSMWKDMTLIGTFTFQKQRR